jgi:hypothetical protein
MVFEYPITRSNRRRRLGGFRIVGLVMLAIAAALTMICLFHR